MGFALADIIKILESYDDKEKMDAFLSERQMELPEKRFVWAVQWHPEFSYRVDENSKLIFREFVKHCQEL